MASSTNDNTPSTNIAVSSSVGDSPEDLDNFVQELMDNMVSVHS